MEYKIWRKKCQPLSFHDQSNIMLYTICVCRTSEIKLTFLFDISNPFMLRGLTTPFDQQAKSVEALF